MKRTKLLVQLLGICVAYGLAGAQDSPKVLFRFPGASLWVNSSEFQVPEAGLVLEEPLSIRADRVVLRGPLVTQGYALTIEAREIDFSNGGSIRAFVSPAQPGAEPSPLTSMAKAGSNASNSCKKCPGGKGVAGKSGAKGARGRDGFTLKNRNAPEAGIVIAVSHIVGIPTIDGKGQQGGRGGKGETGQDGGPGGQGSKRHDRWWPVKDIPPGPGGSGGKGGDGGPGGDGGTGGDAIPIVLYAPKNFWSVPGAVIRSEPGEAGEAGEGGAGGRGGVQGRGGDGGYGTEWLVFAEDTKPGGLGAVGEAGAKGPAGVAGNFGQRLDASARGNYPVQMDTQKVSASALQARKQWFEYHLVRSLDLMLSMSLALGTDQSQESDTLTGGLSLEQKLSVLQQAGRLKKDALKKVQIAWDILFRGTIAKAFEAHPVPALERSLGLAQQATTLLSALVENRPGTDGQAVQLRQNVDQWMIESAQRAVQSCQVWAKELVKLRDSYLPSTTLDRPDRLVGLWVPECKQIPALDSEDFELATEADILARPKDRKIFTEKEKSDPSVTSRYRQYLTVDRQSSSVDEIRKLFEAAFQSFGVVPSAFADDEQLAPRAVFLKGVMLQPDQVKQGVPHLSLNRDTESGRLVGYQSPTIGVTSLNRFQNELLSQAWLWETFQ